MYCDKCRRQSPDNFSNCPYCSAPLNGNKKKKPERFVRKKSNNLHISFKTAITTLAVFAGILAVAAVFTAVLTGSKPESVVKTFVTAINTDDANMYYELYDQQLKDYKKQNWYFGGEETFAAMTEPLVKSTEFYTEKCGEDFNLKYEITQVSYYSDEEFQALCDTLGETYGYTKLPQKAATLQVTVNVKGEKGSYTSIYTDFTCIKIGGKWYMFTV